MQTTEVLTFKKDKNKAKSKKKPKRKVKLQGERFESTDLAPLPISSEIFRKYFMCFKPILYPNS